MSLDGITLKWSEQMKYLGIVFLSSDKLSISLKQSKSKFYASFNAIYGKAYKSSENIILSLVKTYCLPGLFYGLEALDLNKSELTGLNTPIVRAFAKIFKTFNNDTLKWCMFYFDYLPAKFELLFRKFKFLLKMQKINNLCVEMLNLVITDEINDISNRFGFRSSDNLLAIRTHLLNYDVNMVD